MAEPDCNICRDFGYRTCDLCGGIVFLPSVAEPDTCLACLQERAG